MSDRIVGRVKEVTSLTNPEIKAIRALQIKKYRDQQKAFLAEGHKLVVDALDLGWTIKTLIVAKTAIGRADVDALGARAVAAGGLVLQVSSKVLSAITRRDNPQTVIGVFEQRFKGLQAIHPEKGDVWVALERIRDPGNLGTIMRSVDAAGAKGVILIGETTDPFSTETVRATMGSVFAVPVARASEAEFLDWRKNWPGKVIGTHLKGAMDYRTFKAGDAPALLIMGSEKHGLPDTLAETCDHLLRIPQAGRADSLNLAVATGIMLYEIRRDTLTLDEPT